MNRQKHLHHLIQQELERCEALYSRVEHELNVLPKGSLAIDKNGKVRRCISEGGKQYMVMLTSAENDLFLDLKKRRYMTKSLKPLKQRIDNCKRFLKNDMLYDPKQIEYNLPRQYKGTSGMNLFLDGDVDPQEWASTPYRRNPAPIKTAHYTAGGIIVRSKSEAMIGTRLEERRVIFQTEPEVVLKRRRVYPDFAALNRRRRKVMYLEHLGMIDDEDYVFSNLGKLQDYAECGIVLGKNLFITYESQSRPLQIQDIDAVLDAMLG